MQLSEQLGSIIPIFNWSWWQIVLFTFAIGWLAITIISYFEPLGVGKPFGTGRRTSWRTLLYGDLVLPFGVASVIIIAQSLPHQHYWFMSAWWNIIAVLLGFAWIAGLEYWSGHTRRQLLMPS